MVSLGGLVVPCSVVPVGLSASVGSFWPFSVPSDSPIFSSPSPSPESAQPSTSGVVESSASPAPDVVEAWTPGDVSALLMGIALIVMILSAMLVGSWGRRNG